jgi:broad specificity phosphatase PhoE
MQMFNLDPSRQIIGYFVRHGELDNMRLWDSWGSYDLSEEGKTQAEAAARWLSFEKIGRVISSDLPRTMHTAQYLMDTGVVMCPYLACDPNLRPWLLPPFQGKEKTPERIEEFKQYLDDRTLVVPDGESHQQLTERVQVVFQYLAAPYMALPTAFFLHNSVIKALMGIYDVQDACLPGGVIAVFMDEKGEISFQVMLGQTTQTQGVS